MLHTEATEHMRNELKKMYGGDKWPAKVDKMSDKQVYATYQRIFNSKGNPK